MIKPGHIQFMAVAYYLFSYATAFSLWFAEELHLILFGWALFCFNNYQLFTELFYQQNDEI